MVKQGPQMAPSGQRTRIFATKLRQRSQRRMPALRGRPRPRSSVIVLGPVNASSDRAVGLDKGNLGGGAGSSLGALGADIGRGVGHQVVHFDAEDIGESDEDFERDPLGILGDDPIDLLPEGAYTATETAAPPGYLPTPTPVAFTISPSSTFPVAVNVANTLAPTITSTATPIQYRGFGITDTAVIAGTVPATGMSLTFTAYGPSPTPDCTAPAYTSTPLTIISAGSYTPADTFNPAAAGTYYWIASLQDTATGTVITSPCGEAGETTTVLTDPSLRSQATPTASSVRQSPTRRSSPATSLLAPLSRSTSTGLRPHPPAAPRSSPRSPLM